MDFQTFHMSRRTGYIGAINGGSAWMHRGRRWRDGFLCLASCLFLRNCNALPHIEKPVIMEDPIWECWGGLYGRYVRSDAFSCIKNGALTQFLQIFIYKIRVDIRKRIFENLFSECALLRLFQASVIPTLLYGCESWKMTEKVKRKLNGAASTMLATITGRTIQEDVALTEFVFVD